MRKPQLLVALLAGLLINAGLAYAHGDTPGEAAKAVNGGQLQEAGTNHFELVLVKNSKEPRDNPVLLYVTDAAGKKLSTAGATGTATLLAGKDKTVASLTPDGDNRLRGTAKYVSAPGLKAVVSVTLPGKPAEQARFTPLNAESDGHTTHTH